MRSTNVPRKISTDPTTRAYQTDFNFSDATRARIFDLAAQAHYFSGKIDSGNQEARLHRRQEAGLQRRPEEFFRGLQLFAPAAGAATDYPISKHRGYSRIRPPPRLLPPLSKAGPWTKNPSTWKTRPAPANSPSYRPSSRSCRRSTTTSSVINVVRARAQRIMEMAQGAPATR